MDQTEGGEQMNQPAIPDPLLEPLGAVQRILDRLERRGIIIGGIAASLLGEPRLTADIDAMVVLSIDEIPDLIRIAQEEGVTPRIGDVEAFARHSRVLLMHHEQSGVEVDISLGLLPFEIEAAERGQTHDTGSLLVRLPSPEDLIIQKAVAHRPKDLDDIRAIIVGHPNLDWQRIQFWVEQFAEVLEMPELWTDIADLRDRLEPGQRRKG
jgi:hypothetical protein